LGRFLDFSLTGAAGRSYAVGMLRAIAAATVVAQLLCLVPGASAGGTSLLATSRPQRESAQLRYSSRDALAGLSKGAGAGASAAAAHLFILHNGVRTRFTLPAGGYDGGAGWIVNDATRATFANRQAPGGRTGVSRATFISGRRLKVDAKSLGDASPLAVAGLPADTIHVAWVLDDGGTTTTHCAQFAPAACTFRALDAGTGGRLRCRDGVADIGCAARPTCGNGVREYGEQCDGGPLCTAECTQRVTSCCDTADACLDAPAYILSTNLLRHCQTQAGMSSVPMSGLTCGPDGNCIDLPIEPTPVCCQLTDTTCSDHGIRTSLHDLYVGYFGCGAEAGIDASKVRLNAVCGGDGTCVPQ
jgi:hypothetical protein